MQLIGKMLELCVEHAGRMGLEHAWLAVSSLLGLQAKTLDSRYTLHSNAASKTLVWIVEMREERNEFLHNTFTSSTPSRTTYAIKQP